MVPDVVPDRPDQPARRRHRETAAELQKPHPRREVVLSAGEEVPVQKGHGHHAVQFETLDPSRIGDIGRDNPENDGHQGIDEENQTHGEQHNGSVPSLHARRLREEPPFDNPPDSREQNGDQRCERQRGGVPAETEKEGRDADRGNQTCNDRPGAVAERNDRGHICTTG